MFFKIIFTLFIFYNKLVALSDKLTVNVVLDTYMPQNKFESVFGKLTNYLNINDKLQYVYDKPVTDYKINILLEQKDGLIDTSNSSNIIFFAHQVTEPMCDPNLIKGINIRNLDYQGIIYIYYTCSKRIYNEQ